MNSFKTDFNYHNSISNIDSKYQTLISNFDAIELKNYIISSHETYLQLDDDEQKEEFCEQLNNYIQEYLNIIPHQNKFILSETHYIFEDCVLNNKNLQPEKASQAFEYLFIIVNNLILKPWRKEYQKICSYNGYFKHLISIQIPNYITLLKLMGYRYSDKDGILKYQLNIEKNYEYLKLISYDCLIILSEFKFYYQLGNLLKIKGIKPNWLLIYKIRKNFTGDLESNLKNYILHFHNENEDTRLDYLKKYKHLADLVNNLNDNDFISKPKNTNYLSENSNLIDFNYSLPSKKNFDEFENLENISSNNISYEKVIPIYNEKTNSYVFDKKNKKNLLFEKKEQNSNDDTKKVSKNKKVNNYLENTDQIDNYHENSLINKTNDVYKQNFDSNIDYLNTNAHKLEVALKSNDNKIINISKYFTKDKSNTLDKKNKLKSNDKKYSTLEYKTGKSSKLSKNLNNSNCKSINQIDDRWPCKYCTYLNSPKDEVCKMCSKSMIEKTENSLVSGGKECSLCTLVNDKKKTNCQACGNSLKNSPTYI